MAFVLFLQPLDASAEGWGKGRIEREARKLAKKMEVPWDKENGLMDNLKTALDDPWFDEAGKEKPVKGVFLFKAGEGGLVLKRLKGEGLARFLGLDDEVAVSLKSWSGGVAVGGSKIWGVGLIMGLKERSHFGGSYKGAVKQATAGKEHAHLGILLSLTKEDAEKGRAHDLFLVTAGTGLSVGASGAKMKVVPEWKNGEDKE